MKILQYNIIMVMLLLLSAQKASSQTIFFSNLNNQIYSLNISTCATTLVTNAQVFNDMAVGSGTTYYTIFANTIFSVNAATGVSTPIATVNSIITGMEVGSNGTIYVLGFNLFAINPSTGVVTDLGALPNGWFCTGDLVFVNGQFYATVDPNLLINVNITNPSLSTVVNSNLPGASLVAGAGVNNPNCPKMYWLDLPFSGSSIIWEYDINTQTWTQKCPAFNFQAGGAGTPSGYSFAYNCNNCTTDAGSINNTPLNICVNNPILIPFDNNAVLDADDLSQFILFTNPANPMGSILATSNTPTFPYNTAYVTGQTYYIAAIAGNNLNGNVNPSDPCFDISNIVPITWRPKPAVVFTSPVSQLCTAQCATLSAAFSGTPPFSLNYSVELSGNSLGNTIQTFTNNTGAITICAPASTPSGTIFLQATTLTDLFCTCE